MRRFWYVGLEPLNARYTKQLCSQWLPDAFAEAAALRGGWTFEAVPMPAVDAEIRSGKVLDAVGRGIVSLSQMQELVRAVGDGRMADGDVVYLQDFWTPGLEALLYALHMHGRKVRIYARNFAQSVDVYDFTYPMRAWMGPIEQGWSAALSGMFVASEVHREQLRAAGVRCPVHVLGLPFSRAGVAAVAAPPRENKVVYTSRLNGEKNPWFMLDVARAFLEAFPDWSWTASTSAASFTSELRGLLDAAYLLQVETGGRFSMAAGLSKDGYYQLLRSAKVQFNCALQDYVSFTMVEASAAGCDLVFPNFRSFPECVPADRLYSAFDPADALRVLGDAVAQPRQHHRSVHACELGLQCEVAIMLDDYKGAEVNVWHQPAAFFAAELQVP